MAMVLLLGLLLLLLHLPTRLVLRVFLLLSLQTTPPRCRVQELISTLSYYQQAAAS